LGKKRKKKGGAICSQNRGGDRKLPPVFFLGGEGEKGVRGVPPREGKRNGKLNRVVKALGEFFVNRGKKKKERKVFVSGEEKGEKKYTKDGEIEGDGCPLFGGWSRRWEKKGLFRCAEKRKEKRGNI